MADRPRIGLDNDAFRGRLRQPGSRSFAPVSVNRPHAPKIAVQPLQKTQPRPPAQAMQAPAPVTKTLNAAVQPLQNNNPTHNQSPQKSKIKSREGLVGSSSTIQSITSQNKARVARPEPPVQVEKTPEVPLPIVKAQTYAKPAAGRQQRSKVLRTELRMQPDYAHMEPRYARLMMGFAGMACAVFVVGLALSVQTLKTNNTAKAQISALLEKNETPVAVAREEPSTDKVKLSDKPTATDYAQYVVAPDLARYIKIPKLGVDARVLQAGLDNTGKFEVPASMYDAAWFTGSNKPGQPGVTIINSVATDGQQKGIFGDLSALGEGDQIQIVKGDGLLLNYKVTKVQPYTGGNVDMAAVNTPANDSKPGLNLVNIMYPKLSGSNLPVQYAIVFAVQQ